MCVDGNDLSSAGPGVEASLAHHTSFARPGVESSLLEHVLVGLLVTGIVALVDRDVLVR